MTSEDESDCTNEHATQSSLQPRHKLRCTKKKKNKKNTYSQKFYLSECWIKNKGRQFKIFFLFFPNDEFKLKDKSTYRGQFGYFSQKTEFQVKSDSSPGKKILLVNHLLILPSAR